MNKQKKVLITVVVMVFISINIYLIEKKDSKIHQSSSITDWSILEKSNIFDSLSTKGVITPYEENYVYFNTKTGSLERFFVKEGDKIQVGTELYQYSSMDIDIEKRKWELSIEQLEEEIDGLDNQLLELNTYKASVTQIKDDESSIINLSASVEMEILHLEREIASLQSQLNMYEGMLESLEDTRATLFIQSPYDGTVKTIDHSLSNPIITITSNTPSVKGYFEENEMALVEEGQRVTVNVNGGEVGGVIENISNHPQKEPSVKHKSQYSYSILLDEIEESPLIGNHVDVTVVTKEFNEVITIPSKSVVKQDEKSYIYLLNSRGRTEKREVLVEGNVKDLSIIQNGVEVGDYLIKNPNEVPQADSYVTSPINLGSLDLNNLKQLPKKQIAKYVLKGLLTR